nr:putative centromere protein [Ipomoea batatas]
MDTVHEKLDEAMAEIQKLRADYKIKAESSENFKRAYNKQLIKIRDASSNVDKLTLELSMKEDELYVAKQAYEELKSNLKDKEVAIKSLSSANARAREPYRELMAFLKELQDAGINDAGHSSLPKLINKLKEKDVEDEREKVAMLLSRVESLNLIEEQQLPLQKEVDVLKEMLKEASTYQVHLKEQVLKTKSELKETKDTLDRADEELAESLYEGKTCGGFGLDMKRVNKFFDPAKENLNICSSSTKNVEAATVEDRLQFRDINNKLGVVGLTGVVFI